MLGRHHNKDSDLTPEMRRRGVKGVKGVDFPDEPKRARFDPKPRDDVDPNSRGESASHERLTRLGRDDDEIGYEGER